MVILKPPEESWLESVLSLEPAERDGTNLAQSVLTLLINFFIFPYCCQIFISCH